MGYVHRLHRPRAGAADRSPGIRHAQERLTLHVRRGAAGTDGVLALEYSVPSSACPAGLPAAPQQARLSPPQCGLIPSAATPAIYAALLRMRAGLAACDVSEAPLTEDGAAHLALSTSLLLLRGELGCVVCNHQSE